MATIGSGKGHCCIIPGQAAPSGLSPTAPDPRLVVDCTERRPVKRGAERMRGRESETQKQRELREGIRKR